ncbi:MAG: nucleoside monophosphate kinase [Opitutales bacterium]
MSSSEIESREAANETRVPWYDDQRDKQPVQDLEIKDAQLIFQAVWAGLKESYGRENLRFPKEIFWLNGAPGAGKGTHTKFIMKYRDYTEAPIVVSDLLKSPEARKRIDAGLLVGDKEVTELVFRALLNPDYDSGAIVDGYPRTKVQVECLKLLYGKLNDLRREFLNTLLSSHFPKPQFHILVLFIDEAESIARQLNRGKKAVEHNREVEASGFGTPIELRKTDLDEEAARNRYRTFKEQTYDALHTLRRVFHYHYINAHGTISAVQERIINELQYQSSLELDQATYDRVSVVPIASQIIQHARQDLIQRLDDYEAHQSDLFGRVVHLIDEKFMPIILRHAISGRAAINSEDDLLNDTSALAMLLDIFSERGYHAVVDIRREEIPDVVDPKTFRITCRVKKVFRVTVSFAGSEIRRGS